MVLMSACSVSRKLDEGQYLLKKNKLEITETKEKQNFTQSELERYYRQKPNKKMLMVIPFYVTAYKFGNSISLPDSTGFTKFRKWGWKRKSKFKTWVMSNGEPPVILDTTAADRTLEQFVSFMFTRGHFYGEASRKIEYRKKKAFVHYKVNPRFAYSIRNVFTDIPTEDIRTLYEGIHSLSPVKPGRKYDEKMLQQERDRITRVLKDSGFYHFNKAYITFEVDTFITGRQLDLYMKILDQSFYQEENHDHVITRHHQRSRIRNVYINPEYEGLFVQKEFTIFPVGVISSNKKDTLTYYIYTAGQIDHSPEMLIRNILIEPGDLYCLKEVEQTYLYLSDLSNFGNITISFNNAPAPSDAADTTVMWLDCIITMEKLSRQSYELRMDLTHRAGDPGVSSNLVFQNRNLFKGAEVMSLAFKGALEVQKILDKGQEVGSIIPRLPFNTLELGIEADIRIPKFFAPIPQSAFPKAFKPRTRFSGGFNYQERPDYKRYVLKITSGYEWQFNQNVAMALNPLEINAVSINPDPAFVAKINALNDQRIKNSYTDHLITALTFSTVIDKQQSRNKTHYSYARFNIESAGLLVNAFRNEFSYPLNEQGVAMIFHIPYAQYLRTDIDYRQFFRLRQRDHLLAARLYLGLGNPYGNMSVLPFEKSFFVGGANGIRAWATRTLGPGSYNDEKSITKFDRTGDLGIETSFEYRFPVYGNIHSALFLDAGNVWFKNRNENFPGGEFRPKTFLSEMAVGTGFGVRIVSFFVIRIDVGIKIHDPSLPEGERWTTDHFKLKRVNWNFGIGYSI